jgi:predicted nucleic acid-binding protein
VLIVDASVIHDALGMSKSRAQLALAALRGQEMAAPDFIYAEVASALRRNWLAHEITTQRLALVTQELTAMPILAYETMPLIKRALELRGSLTPYDACYVALAEPLGAPLLTGDRRLANAPGIRCETRVLA